MGTARTYQSLATELEESGPSILCCAGMHRRKAVETRDKRFATKYEDEREEKVVCVTSGASFLGLAIVSRLLLRGYYVRAIVHTDEEAEKFRERTGINHDNNRVEVLVATLIDVETLSQAFDGCRGVFHTSAFADPAGLSGYSKSMAELEVKATENVMEACAFTPSIRKVVLTSSLLACIWQDTSRCNQSTVINQDSWSDESICLDKKLWYALGKLRAERTAWRIAEQRGLKLTSICPGLITGPHFVDRNPTPTVAYLKGAQEMYADGLLATVDVTRLAEAHICVFKAMNKTAFGRYVCFDSVIKTEDEAEKLAQEMGMTSTSITRYALDYSMNRCTLSKAKLSNLMRRTMQFCCNEV